MFEPKPMASLGAGLLARKGEAHPATRRAYVPLASPIPLPTVKADAASITPPVREQQKRIAQSFDRSPEALTAVRVVQPRKIRTAFTLRLDGDRHLRLRLASVVSNCSAQQLVTEALDAFLDSRPGLDALVAQARKIPEKG